MCHKPSRFSEEDFQQGSASPYCRPMGYSIQGSIQPLSPAKQDVDPNSSPASDDDGDEEDETESDGKVCESSKPIQLQVTTSDGGTGKQGVPTSSRTRKLPGKMDSFFFYVTQDSRKI
jgi:hypothetical protein